MNIQAHYSRGHVQDYTLVLFLLTVTLQLSHLQMIDHQRIRPPPRFDPCIAVPLLLQVRWLITIQESICRMYGAVKTTSLSHGSTRMSIVFRLRSRIGEF